LDRDESILIAIAYVYKRDQIGWYNFDAKSGSSNNATFVEDLWINRPDIVWLFKEPRSPTAKKWTKKHSSVILRQLSNLPANAYS